MFQFTWPLCTPPMFKFGPRGFQNWFYIHCSSNQKKVPPLKLFLRQIGPNWGSGLSKTIVRGASSYTQPWIGLFIYFFCVFPSYSK